MSKAPYYKFSEYLKEKYGRKIYKIPVNIPCSCPNRDGSKGYDGCIFCGEEGAGFETLDDFIPVAEQLDRNIQYMGPKYGANGFIAYFQNYSNTYLEFNDFRKYISQACINNVVALYISTRPDCIEEKHAVFLHDTAVSKGVDIVVEIGLQSTLDSSLEFLNRRHSVNDFRKSVELLKKYDIGICAHMITDLPFENDEQVMMNARLLSQWGIDQVKCHSLYILKDTELGKMYTEGSFKPLECSEFIERTIIFLRNLDNKIVIQRLMGRAPKERSLFCNYGRSWRAVVDEIEEAMKQNQFLQGDLYNI